MGHYDSCYEYEEKKLEESRKIKRKKFEENFDQIADKVSLKTLVRELYWRIENGS